MVARKKLKKPLLKPIEPAVKNTFENGVKSSNILTAHSNDVIIRKRKSAVLNGDENLNGKRYSKRQRLMRDATHKRTSNKSAKEKLNLTLKAKLSKNDSSKIKLNATNRRKLNTSANLRKNQSKSTEKVHKRKLSKKPVPIAQLKKIKVTKTNVALDGTTGDIIKKKRKSTKKALLPRDFVTEYAKDPTFETCELIPHVSTVAHSRLLIRAVNLNDTKMLKNLIYDKKSICSFTIPRSLNINRDALSYALEKQNMEAIKILLDSKLSKNLASFPDVILSDERTGHNSTMMFGHALRNVTVGRGGKEGNNALLKDRYIYNNKQTFVDYITQDMTKDALSFGFPKSLIQKLSETFPTQQSSIYSNFLSDVIYAIRKGHNQLAGQLVEDALTKGGYGFNLLHKEVLLNTNEKLTPFKSVSVIKKGIYNDRVTPLHCAAINPNPDYLTALLNSRPDYSILDMQNWSIIHYASVCTGTGPLQVLLARAIPTLQMNKDGDTPLHLASALGRVENVKLILQNENDKEDEIEDDTPKDISGSLVKRANKVGYTALHKAAAAGHSDIIPILLSAGADPNKFTPARYDKLTPFMLAAQLGHVNVLKVFVQHGYMKIDTVDHKGRSALAHAIINGQAHVVSYLLRIGASILKKDTSGNSLVHYAAAYGWYFCLKLLMEAGCPPNEPNDWKMTPLAISFMKGHMGLVEYILKQPGVDIDSRINDSTGVTLLLQAVSSQPTKELLSRLKFLLINQKASCNIVDFEGNNAFHYLVETEYREMSKDLNLKYNSSETQKIVFQTTRLLWNNKCDPYAKNCNQETPISLAIQYGCISILNHIYDLTSVLPEEPNVEGNTLLHIMANQAHNDKMTRFCKERFANDSSKVEILKKMAATYNKSGYTPLLWLLHRVPNVTQDNLIKSIIGFIDFLVNTLNSDVAAIDRERKSGQSVTHLAANVSYAEEAFRIILPLRPQLEVVNFNLQTPLTYAIVKSKEMAAAVLLSNGANVNVKMTNMNSLLLLHSVSQNKSFHLIPLMIDSGANIHEINKHTKNSILHYVCRKPHLPFAVESLRKLIEKKIDLDAVNKDGRTALHLAVNFRAGETDASYEIEDLLIESKAKLNIRDNRGRIPLHMAFVKIGKHSDASFMDPIELVTTLVRAMKQSLPNFADEIRVADEFGMTPLHYAAFRGATISCSYLLMEMNCNIDILDRNFNTPFGLAVLNGHEGCALQFQQKGANFITNLNTNLSLCDLNEGNARNYAWQWLIAKAKTEEENRKKLKKEIYPILQEVVSKDWQGILHLMLEKLNNSGVGASFPIAAALNTNRLKLATKLIIRARPSELLVNEDGETLLHILAKNVTKEDITNRDLSEQIIKILNFKGISYDSLDKNKSTALISAAASRNLIVCNSLGQTSITNTNSKTALTYTDVFGRNPFSALFWNINSDTELSLELRKWAESILEQGGDIGNASCQYPLIYPVFVPGVRFLNCETNDTCTSKYTPLMMAVIAGNYAIVEWLLTMRNPTFIDVNYRDDDGRTVLMHACRLNDVRMVRLIINPTTYKQTGGQTKLSTQNKSGILFNLADKQGWTVLDHVVATHDGNFYYANSDPIIRVLFSAGAKIHEKSGDGVTPLERAIQMKRSHLVKCMEELLKVPPAKQTTFAEDDNELFQLNLNQSLPCFTTITNYDQDCQSEIDSIMDTEEESDDTDSVKPDDLVNENSIERFKVILDAEQKVHFSCCLTKVDISYGIHGMYNFYKMQLLEQERGKQLIVLFTRWGRVGDEGQYQKTSFPSKEDAVKEFKKIFRSKTGNVWDSLDAFNPLPNKYRLVELETKKVKRLNQVKINFGRFQKSNDLKPTALPLPLVKLIENLVMAHKNNIKFSGFDEAFDNELPLGRLTFETLKKGASLLERIEELINKRDEIKRTQLFYVINEMDFMNSVLKPCEEFYSLIPVYGFSKEKLKPMFTMDDLREKQQVIHKLIHLEYANKLLIAAQYNLNAVNPFEYVFRCLNTKIEALVEEEEESQLILQYIHNTSTNPECNSSLPKVSQIFRVERSGEIERMKKSGVGNKHLLWHGTSAVNLLSILHRGLKVSPLEAALSGHLFGKGIYFADMFMKSQKYSHGATPKFMLLCEVALGTMHSVKLHHWEIPENKPLPSNCHSLKTIDSRWAPESTTTVKFKGRTMHLGSAVENVLPDGQYHGLDHNEFVVFREDQVQLRYLIQYED